MPTATAPRHSELWQRIRAARIHAKRTQGDVARHLGVSRPAVTLWESRVREHRTTPTTEYLARLAAYCGVSTSWLLDDDSDPDDVWKGDTSRPTDMVVPPKVSVDALASFWTSVRYAVRARNPTLDSGFDVALLPCPVAELSITAPFYRNGSLVMPAAVTGSVVDAVRKSGPELLWAGAATGRRARLHLLLWCPLSRETELEATLSREPELKATLAKTWGITLSMFTSVDAAAQYLIDR